MSSLPTSISRLAFATFAAMIVVAAPAEPPPTSPFRPPSARGAQAQTLVLYSATRSPYSLADQLEALLLRLRRVETVVRVMPLAQATPDRLSEVDYLVVYCPDPNPVIPLWLREALARPEPPILWVGRGVDQLQSLSSLRGSFEAPPFSSGNAASEVLYRERRWPVVIDPWVNVTVPPTSQAVVLLRARNPADPPGTGSPISWKVGAATFFTTDPSFGNAGFLFEDVVLGFYGVARTAPPCIFLRLEDYHCRADHAAFRRMVDYLHARGHPFLVGVIPAYRDPATGRILDLDSQPEFIEALRYAQRRGARLVLHGYAHTYKDESGEGHEFWDVALDRPIEEDGPDYTRGRLQQGLQQLLRQGLFPLAWETPHYAGSRRTYAETARAFSTAVERVQLSDATYLANCETAGPTRDRAGRLVIPENLGYVAGDPTEAIDRIVRTAELLGALRGTVAGCFAHPYLPLGTFAQLVDRLETLQLPFLDLAELDHWVEAPGALLLTGQAERTITLPPSLLVWKAFNRDGTLVAQRTEPNPVSGTRTFKRSGAGDYDLFEFKPVPP